MGPPPDVPTPSQKTDAAGFVQALFAKAPPDTLIEYRCLGGGRPVQIFVEISRRSDGTVAMWNGGVSSLPPFGPTAR